MDCLPVGFLVHCNSHGTFMSTTVKLYAVESTAPLTVLCIMLLIQLYL